MLDGRAFWNGFFDRFSARGLFEELRLPGAPVQLFQDLEECEELHGFVEKYESVMKLGKEPERVQEQLKTLQAAYTKMEAANRIGTKSIGKPATGH